MGVVQSPFFIGLVLFLGMISLARVLLVRGSDIKRGKSDDRRCAKSARAEFPLHDSDGVLVTKERRFQADRRRSCLLAMQDEMESDSVIS